jgi:hypothetical protein
VKRFPRPDKSTPLLDVDGRTMNQAWFDFLGYLDSRGLGNLPDVNNSVVLTNGMTLVYSTATKLWVPT